MIAHLKDFTTKHISNHNIKTITMAGYKDLTNFEISAIIGFWRMGNVEAIITAIVGCELWQVQKAIRDYKFTND